MRALHLRIFLLSIVSSSITNQVQAQGQEKILALQQAQLEKIKSLLLPVGSIVPSLLTEEQFQKLMGNNWVLMKGQGIANSSLAAVSGMKTLPKLEQGEFLRQTLPGGEVGTPQGFATASTGLSIGVEEYQTAADPTPIIDLAYVADNVPGAAAHGGWGGHLIGGMAGDNHQYLVSQGVGKIQRWGLRHTHKINGASETRPVNISVNYFIRLN